MKLFVDAGNSFIKCLFLDGEQRSYLRIKNSEYAAEFRSELTKHGSIDSIWVSNVASEEFSQWLRYECSRLEHSEPVFAETPSHCCGVSVAYHNPSQFGVDRFLALLAAFVQVGRPCIVIDAGTAITIDALDAHGAHLGGVILPGSRQMRLCLQGVADRVVLDGEGEIDLFSKNTSDGITTGCYYAASYGVNEIVSLMKSEMGEESVIVMTGGAARRLEKVITHDLLVSEHLVIDGLEIMARQV